MAYSRGIARSPNAKLFTGFPSGTWGVEQLGECRGVGLRHGGWMHTDLVDAQPLTQGVHAARQQAVQVVHVVHVGGQGVVAAQDKELRK